MNSKLILVQDSDVRRRNHICRHLSLHGYRVLEAINSQHAASFCYQQGMEVDLIITDTKPQYSPAWRHLCPHAQVLTLPTGTAKWGKSGQQSEFASRFNVEQIVREVRSIFEV